MRPHPSQGRASSPPPPPPTPPQVHYLQQMRQIMSQECHHNENKGYQRHPDMTLQPSCSTNKKKTRDTTHCIRYSA